MKKRILSLLLALLMVLGSLPLMGAAAPEEGVLPEVTACPACGALGCTTEHIWCDICQKYDCGLVCYVCNIHGCTTEHKYCELCTKYDCGVDHSFTGPLQLTDAAAAENGAASAPAPQCTCGTESDSHAETCPLYVAPAPSPAPELSLYQQLMATESMAAFEAVAYAAGDSYLSLTEAEIIDLHDKIDELYEAVEEPTEDDTAKRDSLFDILTLCPAAPVCTECGLFNAHTDTCSLKPAQDEGEGEACPDCGFADGLHAVDCASRCSCGEYRPEDGTHIATCALYACPDCGALLNQNGYVHDVSCGDEPEAPVTPDYSSAIGKYAMIIESVESFFIGDGPYQDTAILFYDYEFEENTIFRIENVYWDGAASVMADGSELQASTALWYQVSIAYGGPVADVAELWPADPWVLQDYTDESYPFEPALKFVDVSFCPTCGEPNCTKNHDTCPTCGVEGCTMNHFLPCEVCGSTQCSPHIYCNVCNKYDCGLAHKYCNVCDKYDCGLTHENPFAPLTAPIITPPAYSAGDVTISDRYGNVVNSLVLSGRRETLSAWGPYADYQWQICYDAANDLWANIAGQSSQGIVISPAMFLGTFTGGASIRCRSGSGDSAVYSAPVAVSLASPAAETFRSPVGSMLPQAESGTDADKQYVVVQYLYTDGRIAAGNRVYELQLDSGLTDTHTIPSIPGYKATLESSFDGKVTLADNSLSLNFPAGSFLNNPTTVTVRYEVDYVNYTVVHYLQNVSDDNYTEFAREVKRDKMTGQIIDTAHNTYPGFFNLLYETPAAAADGSTVIEVYYDRYYYLMTFDMGTGGYGTDPIYARYGDTVVAENPTRPGYTFLGWSLDGKTVEDLPGTMPPENRQYIAVWDETDLAKVSIVVWGENADDEEYSYLKTMEMSVKPGTTFTYSEDGARICGMEEHTHSADCNYVCGKAEHSHGRNCYTLTCTIPIHTHSDPCYDCGLSSHTHSTGCYTNVGAAFSRSLSEWSVKGNETNGSIGESYRISGTGNKYIYINGTWYRYTGSAAIGSTVQPNCGKEESTHTHTDACLGCGFAEHTHTDYTGTCYTLTCTQEEHSHSDTCGYACGKTAHTHSPSCYMEGAGLESDLWTFVRSDTVTVEANGSTVMNVYFDRTPKTLTYKYNYQTSGWSGEYKTTKTITAKWGANISTAYEAIAADAGTTFWTKDSDGDNGPYTNYFGIMPQASATYYTRISSNDTGTMTYYGETLTSGEYKEMFSVGGVGGYTVTVEDRYEFLGFTYDHGTSTGSSCSGATFYYTRNSYKLDFNNGVEVTKSESVKYQAPLDAYDTYEPPAPNIYEPGAVTFGGWYLNPQCSDGAEFEPIGKFMPAENLIVYAKWEKVEHEVNYFMTKESYEAGETIPDEMSRLVDEAVDNGAVRPETDPYTTVFATVGVEHGEKISNPSDPGVSKGYEKIHPRAGYTFVGWFYINDEGKETAFDPENMPVDRDLNLYAKWSANKLCKYNIYFALDIDGNGVADTDASGNIIYVAEPLTGSGIAGHTYTFTAKGEADLYGAYAEGYFPNVGSHSIAIDILDEEGTGPNSFTFLYLPKAAVPYTVKYLEKATGAPVAGEKYVEKNKNIIVTETFVPANGYMPDAYQKTLVVSAEEGAVNEIIFWYTKDELHSIYVVNHYVEVVDSANNHVGWTKYTSFQNTGDIGKTYEGTAMDINGYNLSVSYTNQYNTVDKKNGETGAALPTAVSVLYDSNTKINGVLGKEGMELNFYYVRNLYPYEFRFVLKDVGTQLALPEVGKAPYDTYVTQQAKEIKLDLDGDGILEEYRLYDATETEKDIHIKTDGEPLAADAVVTAGMATVNIATFEYIRCTADISVKKFVIDNCTDSDPDPNQEYKFELKVHITEGYHQSSYDTQLDNGAGSTISPELTRPDTICFTLRNGQNFTIKGLPTAQYTLTELSLPLGFTEPKYQYTIGSTVNTAAEGSGIVGEAQNGNSAILQVEHPLHFTVTNTFKPAALEINKSVQKVEESLNLPEVTEFEYTVAFPEGVSLEKSYMCIISGSDGSRTENVQADFSNRTMVFKIKAYETARFTNLPVGSYTVTETDYSVNGYKSNVSVNGGEHTEGRTATVTLANGETQKVDFLNVFPVGDLIIEKTVSKEFFKTPWNGDSFTFTVERTNEGRPLKAGNKYNIFDGDTLVDTATVGDDNKLTVEIPFTEEDAAALETACAQVTHSYTVKNLPAGTYSVVEKENTAEAYAYNQAAGGSGVTEGNPTVEGLVLPAETMPTAEFANELIRPTGSLSLEKLLVPAAGFNENELPQGTEFSFTISLTEDVPDTVTVSKTYKGETTDVTMTDGRLEVKIKANETVSFSGLPIGTYRITEQSIPSYANAFEVKNASGAWEKQPISADNGNLYTELEVLKDVLSEVRCTNVYPVERAQLIVSKDYTKEYDRDKLPEGLSSNFTVTFEEKDCTEYYYDVYSADGTYTSHTATVTEVSDGADTDYAISFSLADGQYAVITGGLSETDANGDGAYDTVEGTPVCNYTVTETNADLVNFNVSYELFQSELENQIAADGVESAAIASADAVSYTGKFLAGKLDKVEFTNQYKKHLGQITINKAADSVTADDSFIFHIDGTAADGRSVNMDVALDGPGSVTIYDVPIGNYRVTEDTGWSWRYTASDGSYSVTIALDNPETSHNELEQTVNYSNTLSNNKWLNAANNAVNTFLAAAGNS